MIELELGLVM